MPARPGFAIPIRRLTFALTALLTLAPAAADDFEFATGFDGITPLAGYRFADPGVWRVGRVNGDPCLELTSPSTHRPKFRSPHAIALLPTPVLGSFVLDARVMSTNAEYAHRDLCVYFGFERPDRYLYLHLGRRAEANSHQVMLVDDADRRAVTTARTDGVDWGSPSAWHRLRVVFDASARRVDAYLDDLDTPVLSAADLPIAAGHVGLGSFDDTGRFDSIRLVGTVVADRPPAAYAPAANPDTPADWTLRPLTLLSDDGGWCWFEGERAIVSGTHLLAGAVAAGTHDPDRRGDIDVIQHDLATGVTTIVELDDRLERDDHDSPALVARADGGVLAVWAKHGPEPRFYSAETSDLATWSSRRVHTLSPTSRVTYSNVYELADEGNRLYDFFRGLDGRWKPSVVWSDDGGLTWTGGHVVIDVPGTRSHRPYVCYASDGRARVDLFYTEGHPRDYDNSVYHVYYERGHLHRSDGTRVATLAAGLPSPETGTRLFEGGPDRVAWVVDACVDGSGRPLVVYSVQVGSDGRPPGQGGDDHRYRIAAWNGAAWQDHPLAFAGTRLYAGEDDYTGLAAIDPDDPATVFISTNADPVTGEPLISRGDGRRHHEIFRGRTKDDGVTWTWTALTRDSTVDNLRPVVPRWRSDRTALLWLRGTYERYTLYDLDVVLMLLEHEG